MRANAVVGEDDLAAWGFLATLVVGKLHRHHQPHAHHRQHAALQTVFLQVNAPSADFAEALGGRVVFASVRFSWPATRS